jgi:hypothetical protein
VWYLISATRLVLLAEQIDIDNSGSSIIEPKVTSNVCGENIPFLAKD